MAILPHSHILDFSMLCQVRESDRYYLGVSVTREKLRREAEKANGGAKRC